jgi:uncharacterized protein YbjT (DUF2867 family)
MAAVAREAKVNALVNMSQMTVSEMSIQNSTPSRQQRQHWLGEQALVWSGLPVVTIRPTMFLESFFQLAAPTVRTRARIEVPFGVGKTSPVAAADVARVVAAVLADPGPHLGRICELTGPRSQDMHGVAREFSDALDREVTYAEIPAEDWERGLRKAGLPEHLTGHLIAGRRLERRRKRLCLLGPNAGIERPTLIRVVPSTNGTEAKLLSHLLLRSPAVSDAGFLSANSASQASVEACKSEYRSVVPLRWRP